MATVICYVYKGRGTFGPNNEKAEEGDTLLLSPDGDTVTFSATEELGFLMLAGKPLKEPIVRYGWQNPRPKS